MARLKLEIDAETFERLSDQAIAERRPIVWQAEIMLRRALGLPFPATEVKASPDLVGAARE